MCMICNAALARERGRRRYRHPPPPPPPFPKKFKSYVLTSLPLKQKVIRTVVSVKQYVRKCQPYVHECQPIKIRLGRYI